MNELATVAVDDGVQMAELPVQGALGLGVARIELGIRNNPAQRPRVALFLYVSFPISNSVLIMDPGLDGFVFAGIHAIFDAFQSVNTAQSPSKSNEPLRQQMEFQKAWHSRLRSDRFADQRS